MGSVALTTVDRLGALQTVVLAAAHLLGALQTAVLREGGYRLICPQAGTDQKENGFIGRGGILHPLGTWGGRLPATVAIWVAILPVTLAAADLLVALLTMMC